MAAAGCKTPDLNPSSVLPPAKSLLLLLSQTAAQYTGTSFNL